jgi:polyphosphate kinase
MYISSADFMTRNTEHRVEIAVPILDAGIRSEIHAYLDCYFRDNTKARRMKSDGRYTRIESSQPAFCAQDELMRTAKASTESIPMPQRRRSISAFKTVYHKETPKK